MVDLKTEMDSLEKWIVEETEKLVCIDFRRNVGWNYDMIVEFFINDESVGHISGGENIGWRTVNGTLYESDFFEELVDTLRCQYNKVKRVSIDAN